VIRRIVRAASLAAIVVSVLAPPAPVAAQAPKADATFDAVWKIVRDTHFDASFDAAQWDRVRDELRPKALAAANAGELRAVLGVMLGRLGLSHFAVIPGSPDTPNAPANLNGQPGLDVRLIDRQVVVSTVDPDGGAAAEGVKPGWIIDAVGPAKIAPLIDAIPATTAERIMQLEAWRAVQTRLRSSSGSSVTFVDAVGDRVTKTITRRAEAGEPVTVGSLPTMFVRVSVSPKTTPGGRDAGLVGFNVWMTAVDKPFQQAVDRFRGAAGIVIDLRGNPGGLAGMIMGIAGHFVSDRATLGVMKTREPEPLRFVANPRLVNAEGERVTPYAGPLAILVDGMTGSASECFAGGLQSLGRARIFGQTTMGQALPALFDRLPNGDLLIHAWGDFVTSTGVRIEGRGVVPDEVVPLTRDDLLAGRDRTLAAALAWIDRASAEGRNIR
jgi:carboxyl-terminal processing protease